MFSSTSHPSEGWFSFSVSFSLKLVSHCDLHCCSTCYTCSAAGSSMSALKQPTIRVVAIIAEGVPESDTKQLIAYARANNKVEYR